MKYALLIVLAAAVTLGGGMDTARADAVGTAFTFQNNLSLLTLSLNPYQHPA